MMSMIQRRKQTAGLIPVTSGASDSGIQIETTKFDPGETVKWVLNYLRTQVLMITRCPPTWLGIKEQGGSNRGDAESMLFSFEVKVGSIHQKIQFTNNMELMPALGFDQVKFNFNPVSSRREKEVVEIAAVFHSMNVKPEAIVRYLERNGITDINPEDIEKPDPMGLGGSIGGGGNSNQKASNLNSPSRRGMNKNTDGMTNNRDSSGGSRSGAAKVREKNQKQR